MKKIIKQLLPPIIYDQLPIYKTYFNYLLNRKLFASNIKFKNQKIGKDLLVIGNGPSLNKINLLLLNDMDMFALNDFYLHEQFNELNVKYYFHMDPTPKWFKYIKKSISQSKLDSLEFFLPFSHYDLIKRSGRELKNKNIIINGGKTYERFKYFIDIHKPTLLICNGLQMLLVTALYMGYKNIYLAGFDFDFLTYKKRYELPHFFNNKDERVNVSTSKNSYATTVCNSGITLKSLESLRDVSEQKNVKIYNLNNPNSFLDMFIYTEMKKLYV